MKGSAINRSVSQRLAAATTSKSAVNINFFRDAKR